MERESVLRAAKEEADRANRAKTDFLTNMSHELRTPLSAIIGFSEMIVRETYGPVSQPKYRDFADDILHSGQHLLDIISEILDVAKLQSGTMELRLKPLRPRLIIDDAVRIVRKQAQEAGIALDALVPDNMPMIEGDPVRLRQVLLNLLSNAIKFTPRGGTVSLLMARCRKASTSRCATPVSGWRPRTSRVRSSHLARWIPACHAAMAAPGWVFRSASCSSSGMADRWRFTASLAAARLSA